MSFDRRKRTGAHSQIPRTSDWDMAIDVDGGKGQLRDRGNLSAFVYQEGGRFSKERRIPKTGLSGIEGTRRLREPWQPIERDIANIPAVGILGGSYPTHSGKTLSPQTISVDSNSQKRSNEEWRSPKEHLIAPSPKARRDALRLTPYMSGQQRYLANFPIACEIRQRINRLVRR